MTARVASIFHVKSVTINVMAGASRADPLATLLAQAIETAAVSAAADAASGKAEPERFCPHPGDGMISDRLTGKIWEAEAHEFPNAEAAEKYVRELRLGGFDDWTIADVDLHQTILDRSLREPACDPVFNSQGGWHLTSTPYKADKNKPAGSSGLVWVVSFGSGSVGGYGYRHGRCWCRAVRSVAPAGQ